MKHSQFARVVKGVDLRSTGGNSAWVRTPQLTSVLSHSHWRSAGVIRKHNEDRRNVDGDDGDADGVVIDDDHDDCCGDHKWAIGHTRI
jgi:hypothetical protein